MRYLVLFDIRIHSSKKRREIEYISINSLIKRRNTQKNVCCVVNILQYYVRLDLKY